MIPQLEFEDIIEPYMVPLKKYCFFLTGSKWEGEDLFQDALLRAYRLYRKNGAPAYPQALLFKIARNLNIDSYRRRKAVNVPIDEALKQPYHDPNYASVRDLLEWMADRLHEREFEALMLSAVFRCTNRDIADKLNCTEPAVRMVLYRARHRLDKLYGTETAVRKPGAKTFYGRKREQTVERWTEALMTGEMM